MSVICGLLVKVGVCFGISTLVVETAQYDTVQNLIITFLTSLLTIIGSEVIKVVRAYCVRKLKQLGEETKESERAVSDKVVEEMDKIEDKLNNI